MKIDHFQNVPSILQSIKSGRTSSPPAGSRGQVQGSSVSLSSFAEVLQTLQREEVQGAKLRGAKVEKLSQLEQEGGLSVDLKQLAQSLVDLNVIDARG